MHDFDDQHPRIRILFGLVAVLIVIGGLWLASSFIWPEDNDQITILKADNTPYKTKPDQPGGMQIPHQDKLIFNTLSSDGKPATVERILPGPEQPLNTPQSNADPILPTAVPSAAPQRPAAPVVDAKTAPLPQAAPTAQVAPPAPQPTKEAPPPVSAMGRATEEATPSKPAANQPVKPPAAFDMSKGEVLPDKKPEASAPTPLTANAPAQDKSERVLPPPEKEVPQQKEEAAEEPQEQPTAGPKSKVRSSEMLKQAPAEENEAEAEPPKKLEGKARFQLASFFDKPSADKALAQFRSKFADALNGASLAVVSATINGGKQVFRIQGATSSMSDASEICSGIKAKGGSCVTIK